VAHPARPVDLDGVLEERQYSNNVKLLKLLAFVNCCYCQNVMAGNDYSLQTIRQTHMQSERARGEAIIMTSLEGLCPSILLNPGWANSKKVSNYSRP